MIELSELVRQLRQELYASMGDGSTTPLRFELGPVEIEATVAVDREAGASGKVRFLVVEAGGTGKQNTSQTQRIKLTLQPHLIAPDGTRGTALIAGNEVEGEL
ncbi:trypco2 family protein [Streptomyces albidoflavus]